MKINYSTLIIAALALVACNKEKLENGLTTIPDDQKEQISFSMSDDSGVGTKAGFTGATTRIVARFQSDEKGTSNKKYTRTVLKAAKDNTGGADDFSKVSYYTDDNIRYWDDAYGRKAQVSVYAVAIPNSTDDTKLTDSSLAGGATWATESEPNNSIEWSVSVDQSTAETLANEDLAYSNNIKDGGKDGIYIYNFGTNKYVPDETGKEGQHSNGRMIFQLQNESVPDGPGKFNKGHLKFNHSLSRITIELVKGNGFGDFKFASGTQIQLNNMNVKGTLNIKEGSWTIASSEGVKNITKMQPSNSYSTAAGTYMAQLLPKYEINSTDNATNMIQFTIDNNTYYITEKMVFDALKSGSWFGSASEDAKTAAGFDNATAPTTVTMAQGQNYKFKITVNKTKIEHITATIAAWSEVTAADQSIDNAHFAVSTFDNTSTRETSGVHLFRITETLDNIWSTGTFDDNYPDGKGTAHQGNYKNDEATVTYDGTNNVWKTNWYFDDNKTLYYIRSLNDLACKGSGEHKSNLDNSGSNTYFKMQNGSTYVSTDHVVDAETGIVKTDYHWGAPFKTGLTTNQFKYYTATQATTENKVEGYGELLQKGIPATNSTINITELHMMSNIKVVLKSTSGADKVNLGSTTSGSETYSKIELVHLVDKATVDMGYGLVTPSTAAGDLAASQQMDRPYTYYATAPAENTAAVTNAFTWSVVPQELVRTSGTSPKIGIKITTPDNNEYYYVKDLSSIKATSVGTSQNQTTGDSGQITYWYPNHSYTYTFVLSKKGIDSITCTVANWSDVVAADTPIDLES